jgi:N-hydroxyarylamine O-acetyltransferase
MNRDANRAKEIAMTSGQALTPGRAALDRDAYLARIAYEGSCDPTLETLRALHFAHASAIPFENLDIVLGHAINLDMTSLQAKLVTAGRGGYCFEQNALFAAVLESLGFEVIRLAARVRFGAKEIRPRTHMLLEVRLGAESWLADVGFGCSGPLYPIRLFDAVDVQQGVWTFRIRAEGDELVLESRESEGWLDLYAFTREPQNPVDYETGNYYTSTHPSSTFVQNLVVQRGTLSSRLFLRNRELTELKPPEKTMDLIEGDEPLVDLLASRFGLIFPRETRFPILTSAAEAGARN